jgi:uncharacterized membrane protein (DUF4010 family)
MQDWLGGVAMEDVRGLGVALGVGLLIGIERERRRLPEDLQRSAAGVRSFTLAALCGGVASLLGPLMLAIVTLAFAGLLVVAYLRTSEHDPGLTSEVALLATLLLGALAMQRPGLAAGLAVLVTLLLAARARIHRLSRELISEAELRDGLLLAAAALIVLPLLPDHPIDPLGVVNPARIWLLVVLIMAIGALGHVLLRAVGSKRGFPLAGFFAGFVSSTAAVAGFGERAREQPALLRTAVGAALAANLGSLLLFVPVLGSLSATALPLLRLPLMAAGSVLLLGALAGLRGGGDAVAPPAAERRMFRFRHALLLAGAISGLAAAVGVVHQWLGPQAAVAGATVAALAEVHASAATLAQLHAGGAIDDEALRWGLVAVLGAAALAKSMLAWVAGGRRYGARVTLGLLAMALAAAAATALPR